MFNDIHGAGKSVCLEALAFACGVPATHIRLKSFSDLVQGHEQPQVTVEWTSVSGDKLTVTASVTSKQGRCAIHASVQVPVKKRKHPSCRFQWLNTCRTFRLNGKNATCVAVRQALVSKHVFGEFSFVRQAQVAELVKSSSPEALARVITGVLWHCSLWRQDSSVREALATAGCQSASALPQSLTRVCLLVAHVHNANHVQHCSHHSSSKAHGRTRTLQRFPGASAIKRLSSKRRRV